MAVIVQYVVVRDGEEKMTFATKKEADAHDKMLDIADHLYQFLKGEKLDLSEDQLDRLSLFMAKNRDVVQQLLRGGKLPGADKKKEKKDAPPPETKKKAPPGKKAVTSPNKTTSAPEKKSENRKQAAASGK